MAGLSLATNRCLRVANGRRRLATLWLAIVLLTGGSGEVSASDSVLYYDWPFPFLIMRPSLSLFISGEIEQDIRKTPGSRQKVDANKRVLKLKLDTRGYVYHPNLMVFGLKLQPEFRWQRRDQPGMSAGSSSDFLGYSINTSWLREKPYTLSLHSSNSRSDFSSTLSPDQVVESRNSGAIIMLKSTAQPTSLSYNNSTTNSFGVYTTRDRTERWRLGSKGKTENSRTRFNIDMVEYDRTVAATSSVSEKFSAALHNSFNFGERNSLASSASFQDFAVAGLDRRSTSLSSRLKLQHRKNLGSNYSASVRSGQFGGRPERSASLGAGVHHLLYENLTSSLSLNGAKSEADSGVLNNYGGLLSFAYSRRIPWGSLGLTLGSGQRIRDDQRTALIQNAEDQVHVFAGISTSITLEDANVDIDSILMTDDVGLVVYILGVDYEVEVLGSSTIITRNSFGGIGDDQAVSVSYSFEANPPAKTNTSHNRFRATLRIGTKLQLYYSQNRVDERFIEGTPHEFPLDSESKQAGARLTLGWSTTEFDVTETISSRNSQRRMTARQTMNFQPKPAVQLNVSGQFVRAEFVDTGEVLDNIGLASTLGWNFRRRGSLNATVHLRRNRGLHQDQTESGLTLNYKWRFGAWLSQLRLRLRDTSNAIVDDDVSRWSLYFETTRRFSG